MCRTKVTPLSLPLLSHSFPFLSLASLTSVLRVMKLAFGPLRTCSSRFKKGADIAVLLPTLWEQRDIFHFTFSKLVCNCVRERERERERYQASNRNARERERERVIKHPTEIQDLKFKPYTASQNKNQGEAAAVEWGQKGKFWARWEKNLQLIPKRSIGFSQVGPDTEWWPA